MRGCIMLLSLAVFLGMTQLNFAQDAKKNDSQKIQGKWEISGFVVGGKNIAAAGRPMTFAGNMMTLDLGTIGNGPRTYTFKLDEKTKPKTIEMTELGGAKEGETNLGIYRFDGLDLVICMPNQPGQKRIVDFESKEGSANVLIKLKREAK